MAPHLKRAEVHYSRNNATALLRTKDRQGTIFVKLSADGTVTVDIFKDAEAFHRVFAPRDGYGKNIVRGESQSKRVEVKYTRETAGATLRTQDRRWAAYVKLWDSGAVSVTLSRDGEEQYEETLNAKPVIEEPARVAPVVPRIASAPIQVGTPVLKTCRECGAEVRQDHLQRHLRRVHRKEGATGKIRLNDLAREVGVKSKSVALYLAQLGHEFRSYSHPVDGGLADKVRQHFHETADSQEKLKGQSKADEVPVERFSFELLPPGSWGIEDVIAHYRREAHRLPTDLADRGRLEALKSLRPAKCYVGKELWSGYVVFEFSGSSRVVLEKPFKGNATYVLWGDWRRMVGHTKLDLRTRFPQNYTKIVHKGDWLGRIRAGL